METHIIDFCTAVLAAIIVMVLHELPKTLVFYNMDQDTSKSSLKNALKIQHYIDPIGLIFCVATYGGFSKPYMYRIKDKKLNKTLGITGLLSLIVVFLLSAFALKLLFGVVVTNKGFSYNAKMSKIAVCGMYLCFNLAFMSIGMFLVNLFPIATFDMGNILAGVSPMKFYEFLRKDYFIKILLLFVLMLRITTSIAEIMLSLVL